MSVRPVDIAERLGISRQAINLDGESIWKLADHFHL